MMFSNKSILLQLFPKNKTSTNIVGNGKFWQWRKRKRLVQLGYKPISRMKHYKIARFERHHVEKYTESGGDVHSVH